MTRTLSVLVKLAREKKGLTQNALAYQLSTKTGEMIDAFYVSRIERGIVRRPERKRLIALAELLEVPVEEMLEAADYYAQETLEEVMRIPVQEISAGPGVFPSEDVTYIARDEMQDVVGQVIAYRVRGTSMEHVGIPDGSLVFVDKDRSPKIGDDVVAWLPEGTGVVKRLIEQDGKRYLKGNGGDPIPVDEGVVLGGVVVKRLV